MEGIRKGEQVRWHLHGWNSARVVRLARWGVAHFPRPLSDGIGHCGSWLAFRAMKEATAALMDNQRVVAPELGQRDLRALALRTYRSYASEQADLLRCLAMNPRDVRSFLSPLSEFDPVRVDGGGTLVVTGHLGNVELAGVMLRVLFDDPLTAVVLPERDPGVNDLRREMRASFGIESLEVRGAVDTALRIRRLLAENRVVALVADRALGRDRVEVEFFGRPTGFLRSPALMGYATGAPLVPAFILRQADGGYAGFASDPIYVARTGDRDAALQAAMQAFARVLEKHVRAYPHLWYQFYPYWGGADWRRSLERER
jgi:KDO2-lipid IV(A) lauroyltransferase